MEAKVVQVTRAISGLGDVKGYYELGGPWLVYPLTDEAYAQPAETHRRMCKLIGFEYVESAEESVYPHSGELRAELGVV